MELHGELTAQEKEDIQAKIAKVTPEDEAKVRAEFAGKYGKVGKMLIASDFRVVRDLALNVTSLWEMLVDPDYTISRSVKAGIVFGLAYFISPIDAIPDAAPAVGFLDDALVVAFVIHLLSEDISKYRAFRKEQGRPLPVLG